MVIFSLHCQCFNAQLSFYACTHHYRAKEASAVYSTLHNVYSTTMYCGARIFHKGSWDWQTGLVKISGYSVILKLAFIPAERHLQTASGTLDLGGSISDIRPTKQRLEMGKFNCSVLNS